MNLYTRYKFWDISRRFQKHGVAGITKEERAFLFALAREAQEVRKRFEIEGSITDWMKELDRKKRQLTIELYTLRVKIWVGKRFSKSSLLNAMNSTRQWVMSLFG